MSNLSISPAGRRYGALPDPPDERDYSVASMPVFKGKPWYAKMFGWLKPQKKAPASLISDERVSHEEFLGPVKDQGNLGACTGFAGAGLREFLYRKYNAEESDKSVPADKAVFSPLFLYWWNRRNDGKIEVEEGQSAPGTELKYVNIDRGANMRSICRSLRWQGVCLEKDNPYKPAKFKERPELADLEQAVGFRAGAFHRIDGLEEMKSVLKSGYCFVAAIQVYESFESEYVRVTGQVPMPKRGEKLMGGHAILVFGYDDKKRVLLCRNSWGSDWGDRGNFYIPYEFAMNPYLMSDCYVQHLGKAWK